MNASTRMVIDSLRTMVIWGFSLAVKWETFCWVEIIGFVVLLAGSMVYNQVIRVPRFSYPDADGKYESLLVEGEDEGAEFEGSGYVYEDFNGGAQQKGRAGQYGKVEADF